MPKPTPKPRFYEARVRCTIIKLVTCECAEPPTEDTLWETATDEVEIDQEDYKIVSVKEVLP